MARLRQDFAVTSRGVFKWGAQRSRERVESRGAFRHEGSEQLKEEARRGWGLGPASSAGFRVAQDCASLKRKKSLRCLKEVIDLGDLVHIIEE
jgi:hypothetical protein